MKVKRGKSVKNEGEVNSFNYGERINEINMEAFLFGIILCLVRSILLGCDIRI